MVRRCGAPAAAAWPDAAAAPPDHDGTLAAELQRAVQPRAAVQRNEASGAPPWPGPAGTQVRPAVPWLPGAPKDAPSRDPPQAHPPPPPHHPPPPPAPSPLSSAPPPP